MKNIGIGVVILFIAIIGSPKISNATHIVGGEITYECVGQDSFLITTTLFRDCSGANTLATIPMNFVSTCGGSVSATLARQTVTEVSQLCPTQLTNSTCNGGTLLGLERHIYTGIVVLSAPCNSWTMSYSVCCRPNMISNLTNPGSLFTYLYANMYSLVDSCNSSPYFTSPGTPSVYLNQLANLNLTAADADGDSLAYFMSPGYENSTTLVPYSGTYTAFQPLPGANLVLNSQTGQLTFTPNATGTFVVVVRVEEYDRTTGVIKGAVIRDFIISVVSGAQSKPNFSSAGISNLGDGSIINGELNACIGDSLDFSITVSDANTSDIVNLSTNVQGAFDSSAIVTFSGTNPVVMNVKWRVNNKLPGTYNFSVVAEDNGCPVTGIISNAFILKISGGANAGSDQLICAGDSVQLNAVGGSTNVWTVLSGSAIDTNSSSANYNMTCSNCLTPKVFPAASTTYLLVTNALGSCGNLDTVTVAVSPSFTIQATNDTAICSSDSLNLSIVAVPNSGNYSFQWSDTSTLSDATISNPVAYPNADINYLVTVDNGSGCQKTESIQVLVNVGIPNGFIITGDSVVCSGGTIDLNVTVPSFTVPSTCGTTTPPTGAALIGTIGTGTTTTTPQSYPSVYGRYYWGNKHQFLYTASELSNMGLASGSIINSLGFDVSTIGNPNNMDNMTIRMGCTNVSALTTFITGLSTVVPSHTYNPIVGWNMHNFTQSYVWDGVSNLVVEVCSNNASYDELETSNTRFTATSFTSVVFYRGDNATVCSSTTTAGVSSDRPNTRFNHMPSVNNTTFNYAWSPTPTSVSTSGLQATITPTMDMVMNLIVSDTAGVCSRTFTKNIFVSTNAFDAGFDADSVYCLNSGLQTFNPIVSGGIFTGVGVNATGEFDPSTAGAGIWPINYNIPQPTLCSNDSTILVTVLGLPDPTIAYTEICVGTDSVNLTAATPGGLWSGIKISDPVNGVFNSSNTAAGNYTVIYTLTSPCASADTAFVKIIDPYQFTLSTNSINVCENETLNLSNLVTLSNAPTQGSNPLTTFTDVNGLVSSNGIFNSSGVSPGSYLVSVTVSDANGGGCSTSDDVTVVVRDRDFAEIIADPTFCTTQNNGKIFVSPWLFGAGVTYSQRPLGNLGANDTLDITPFGQNGQFNPQIQGEGSWEISINRENNFGCIGTIIDTIYVLPKPDTSVTNIAGQLTANAGQGYIYQWLDCDDNMSAIPGATSQTFVPANFGNFAVSIKAGNCIETSGCHAISPLSINELNHLTVNVYPNPVGNELFIEFDNQGAVTIEVLDNLGKVILSKQSGESKVNLNMTAFSSGVYFIKITADKGVYTERVVKE